MVSVVAAALLVLQTGAAPADPVRCRQGQVATAATAGHCCWPGQTWSDEKDRCVGAPQCPAGFVGSGNDCEVGTTTVGPEPSKGIGAMVAGGVLIVAGAVALTVGLSMAYDCASATDSIGYWEACPFGGRNADLKRIHPELVRTADDRKTNATIINVAGGVAAFAGAVTMIVGGVQLRDWLRWRRGEAPAPDSGASSSALQMVPLVSSGRWELAATARF